MADTAVYLYALGEAALADESDALADVDGVDSAPVRVIASGRLAAVVSSVEPGRFGEEALRHHLEDLQWLERTARAHHRVVDVAFRLRPVAPVGLVAIFVSDENVRALLEASADRILAVIDRLRGRVEWGVKMFALRDPGMQELEQPTQKDAAIGPGAAYLMRKRASRQQATRQRQLAAEAAEEAHRSLAALAVASRRYPAQDPRLVGRDEEMVMNVAYLVDEAAAEGFASRVEGWPEVAIRLDLTGPWVPYSFADAADVADQEDA